MRAGILKSTALRSRTVAIAVAAWFLFAVVYGMLMHVQSYGAMGLGLSVGVALVTTFAPAMMSPVIWWLAGTESVKARRFAARALMHVVLALVFAGAWATWMIVVARSGRGARMATTALTHGVLPWQLVVGVLIYGFVAAVASAVQSIERARQMELSAEHAERLRVQAHLTALRAHMDPHFFFNTLHSLSEMLVTDPAAARVAIERLSDLFRYTLQLDRGDVDLVTVEREWRVIESYLWLEGLRLGARLRVSAMLDDDALACMIPPFTLQPIVENAVRHGLSPKPSGGSLAVTAREHDGWLRLEVTDDGLGCTPEDLAAATGLGLRSVQQRLAAHYGDAATVRIAPRDHGGTVVSVELPAAIAGPEALHCPA